MWDWAHPCSLKLQPYLQDQVKGVPKRTLWWSRTRLVSLYKENQSSTWKSLTPAHVCKDKSNSTVTDFKQWRKLTPWHWRYQERSVSLQMGLLLGHLLWSHLLTLGMRNSNLSPPPPWLAVNLNWLMPRLSWVSHISMLWIKVQ